MESATQTNRKRGRKKNPRSLRSMAVHCSHTSIAKSEQAMQLAREQGCQDELYERIMAGEKLGSVLSDLLPELHESRQVKQRVAAFKSSVKKLIQDHDVDPAVLIAFIVENFGRPE